MNKKRSFQCLMIETKDKRNFFTHKKNYMPLIEFAKTFKAQISVVKTNEAELLDLVDLSSAICNPYYKQKANFEIVEVL